MIWGSIPIKVSQGFRADPDPRPQPCRDERRQHKHQQRDKKLVHCEQ